MSLAAAGSPARPPRRGRRTGSRLWREWCFARVAFGHFRVRFLLMGAILVSGALMFIALEPEKGHTFFRALFFTWSLVFGEAPEEFPRSPLLRFLFFLVPVLGLTVIIEGIVDFALMLRDRRRYERSWCIMLASSFRDHVVLVGFGRLGYRTFLLLRRMGEAVVVIERDPQGEFMDDLRREGSPVIVGDARREALLAEANVAHARSIVLATDNDMVNLEAALDARRINPRIRVVLRIFDPNIADKVGKGFGIENALSQSALSAPAFATAALEPAIVNSFAVGERLIVMQRWLIRSSDGLAGRTVGEILGEKGLCVVEHRREGGPARLFPPPDLRLEPGDGVIVQGTFDGLSRLRGEETGRLGDGEAG
jgi:Trk K+ transport system NAD-binding subunit